MRGICPVCGRWFNLVYPVGWGVRVVPIHGPRAARCPGSRKLPRR